MSKTDDDMAQECADAFGLLAVPMHEHAFRTDSACKCGIWLSQLVQWQQAQMRRQDAEIERLREALKVTVATLEALAQAPKEQGR